MDHNLIAERCAHLGVTQKWLSQKSGVPESSISSIRHGRQGNIHDAIRIARALITTAEELFPTDYRE